MARFQRKRLHQPDEVREYPKGRTEIFQLDDFVIGRMVMERGREISKTGDGVLALFDGAARAVECAAAIASRVREIGIDIRAGLHSGEVELVAGGVRGVAVHTASRIMALAGAGEILVSSTTHELSASSGLSFTSRGRHALKGLVGDREVYALVPGR
jgi:class 3 adenylate cyclase